MAALTLIQHFGLFTVMLGCAVLIVGSVCSGFLVLGFGHRVAEAAEL